MLMRRVNFLGRSVAITTTLYVNVIKTLAACLTALILTSSVFGQKSKAGIRPASCAILNQR
jgi:hypothetical protein